MRSRAWEELRRLYRSLIPSPSGLPILPPPLGEGRVGASGCQIADVRRSPMFGYVGGDPVRRRRRQAVQAPAELVAVALGRILDRQVGQLAPGKSTQQVPGGALGETPRVRPEGAPLIAKVGIGIAGRQRQPVGTLEAGTFRLDDEGVGRIRDRAARQHRLAGPDPIGAGGKMLVE